MIRKSGLNHEFRVKPVPGLIGRPELGEIANYLAGAPRFVIERFDSMKSMDEDYRSIQAYSMSELESFKELVSPYFNETVIQS